MPIADLATGGLRDVQDAISRARELRVEADKNAKRAVDHTENAERNLAALHARMNDLRHKLQKVESSWFRKFRKRRIAKLRNALEELVPAAKVAIAETKQARIEQKSAEEERDATWLDAKISLSGPEHSAWSNLAKAFSGLAKSQYIWDVTAARAKRAGADRSSAIRVIERKATTLDVTELSFFNPGYEALHWRNANGDDLYFYPGLCFVVRDENQFAVLDMKDVELQFEPAPFQESEITPTDSDEVGRWWLYSNKDGTPDRRYSNNRSFPIYLYGQICITHSAGINESFKFSNSRTAALFCDRYSEFRSAIGAGNSRNIASSTIAPFHLPTDVLGWEQTRWGMTEKQVAAALGSTAQHITPPEQFEGFYAPLKVVIGVAGYSVEIFFQFSLQTKILSQVLLRCTIGGGDLWTKLCDLLTEKYGPPFRIEKVRQWRFDSTTIELHHLSTPGLDLVFVRYYPTRKADSEA